MYECVCVLVYVHMCVYMCLYVCLYVCFYVWICACSNDTWHHTGHRIECFCVDTLKMRYINLRLHYIRIRTYVPTYMHVCTYLHLSTVHSTRNLQTSKAPLESQPQGTSLFSSAQCVCVCVCACVCLSHITLSPLREPWLREARSHLIRELHVLNLW